MSSSKVTPTQADDHTPGKVIPAPSSALQKLADSLAACTTALATAERERRAAEAILAEASPAPFDHAAAGSSIAQSRVADLLNGTATADAVQQRLDSDALAVEAQAAAFAKRQAEAQAQAERGGPMIAALRAQALELDRAVRTQLAKLGRDMEASAAKALADAVVAYSTAILEYRAVSWLQQAEQVGSRGKQFDRPEESELVLAVPRELWDCLPPGWAPSGTGNLVRFDRFDLVAAIGERRCVLMEEATRGVYPQAGEGLRRTEQEGGEA